MRREDVEAVYRLTPLQEGMLYHALSERDKGVYVQQFLFTLAGALDADRLRQAWDAVTERYSVLRTLFVWQGVQQPIQIVRRRVEPIWLTEDWTPLPSVTVEQQIRDFLDRDRRQGFDLTNAPLVRFAVIRTAPDEHKVLWTFHHILLDGWSGSQVLKEWLDLYCNPAHELPQTLPFKDYVEAARRALPAANAYWQDQFPGSVEVTALNLGPADSVIQGAAAFPDPVDHFLDRGLTQAIDAAVRRYRVTANALMAAAWAVLLAHHTSRREVLFGMVCSGRSLPLAGVETTVGLTINTLPVHFQVDPRTTVEDWVKHVHASLAAAIRHEHASLQDIVKRTRTTAGTAPLFDTLLAYENYPEVLDTSAASSGLRVTDIEAMEQGSTPLSLSVTPGERMLVRAQFDRRKFSTTSVVALLKRFERVLEQMTVERGDTLAGIQPLTAGEFERTVLSCNDTTNPGFETGTLHEVFARQAEKTPDLTALMWRGGSLDYATLEAAGNTLAVRLAQADVGVDDVVAVCCKRSPEAIVAMLAIMKAGAAFMPVDASYPTERIRYMVRDSGARLVLRNADVEAVDLPDGVSVWTIPAVAGHRVATSDSLPAVARPARAAYVIYTSGSTGTPKGVVGTHAGALNRFRWMYQAYPFAPAEVACQKTALSFVDSIWETFGPLLAGVPLLIVSEEDVLSPPALVTLLARYKVSRLVLVPSLLQVLLEGNPDLAQRVPALRLCMVSGEPLSAELARLFRNLMPGAKLLNLYGSSEVSADISCFDLTDWDASEQTVPIGRPIANSRLYVLNDQMQPLPEGAPGQIYAAGAGLAAGYHRQPERTHERFLETTIDGVGTERLFATGDVGKWRADGNLDYSGRADRQLKVGGVRIEPGEIESVLLSQPGVRAAVVAKIAPPSRQESLAAWVDCDRSTQTSETLLDALRRQLPPYLVPRHLLVLESMPLLPNGKIDRAALPSPTVSKNSAGPSSLATGWAPERALTVAIAAMFERILAVESVAENDNFFEIGGASLTAMKLLAELASSYETDLPIESLFAHPTPKALSAVLLANDSMPSKGCLVPIKAHGRETPFFCIYGDAFFLSRHLPGDRPFYWLTPWPRRMQLARCPRRLDYQSIAEIADQYLSEIRRVQPKGPYQLSGSCAGAVIAMETARQLRAAGEEVALLALFDLPATREPNRKPSRKRVQDKLNALRQADNGENYVGAVIKSAAKYGSHRLRLRARLRSLRVRYHILTGREMSLGLARRYTNEKVYSAVARYQQQPYTGKTLMFRTQEWAGEARHGISAGIPAAWTALFPSALEVHTLSAPRHDDLFREPYVQELAEKLKPHLR